MDHVSLTPAAFQILLALVEGPRHGYAIMKDVSEATRGEVRLNPGTLYTTIRKLVEDDLIRETAPPARDEESDERRRYYAITPMGRRIAKGEFERLRETIERAAKVLLKPAR